MAATWDSAYLLGMFNRLTGRPVTGDSIIDATKYQWLNEAQNEIIGQMEVIVPYSLYPKVAYGSIPTLTTTDNQVYTFGPDGNSYANFPVKMRVFRSLNDIPTNPLLENVDFMNEGTQIRALNNGTLPATLYAYGIFQPADLDATHQPVIFPEPARSLIAVLATKNFAEGAGVRNDKLADRMIARIGAPWGNKTDGEFARWCLTWKSQFPKGGALQSLTGLQVAVGSSYNAGF